MGKHRLNIELNDEAYERLKQRAGEDLTMVDVVRQALNLDSLVRDTQAKGGKVLIQENDDAVPAPLIDIR
jgi:hypothetical protein